MVISYNISGKLPENLVGVPPLYGNNVRKCFIESDFLEICSGIPPLKLLFFLKVAGKKDGNPLKL